MWLSIYLSIFLYNYMSIYLPIHYTTIHMSIYLPIQLYVYCLFTFLFNYMSIYLPIQLYVYLPSYTTLCLSIFLYNYMPIYFPIHYTTICLSTFPIHYTTICLSTFLYTIQLCIYVYLPSYLRYIHPFIYFLLRLMQKRRKKLVSYGSDNLHKYFYADLITFLYLIIIVIHLK